MDLSGKSALQIIFLVGDATQVVLVRGISCAILSPIPVPLRRLRLYIKTRR